MTNIVGYIVYGKFEETFELLDLQQSQMSVTFSRVNNVSYEKHVDIHAEPAFYCALISQIYLLYLLPVIYCENGDILYLALCHFTIIKYPFQLIFSCPRVKCRPPAQNNNLINHVSFQEIPHLRVNRAVYVGSYIYSQY